MAEIGKDVLDSEYFFKEVLPSYADGTAYHALPADKWAARSLVPPATGDTRDFSYIAPNIPKYDASKCIGCMNCINVCPDAAIYGKVATPDVLEQKINEAPEDKREFIKAQFSETPKFFSQPEKKGEKGGLFSISIFPDKCKGCGECVTTCGPGALSMQAKNDEIMTNYAAHKVFTKKTLPATEQRFINEKNPLDMMLKDDAWLYVGGAGSCMGCGETTALRMMLAATGYVYGPKSVALFAATGCNSVYGSTYPYNPFTVPWSNSLFENVTAFAMGARLRWDQMGRADKKIWAIAGDGALYDIGFQPLSRLLASNLDVNVICLDTQVYSNTGGQASTASFMGQNAKMSAHGKSIHGKQEQRKELSLIAMMHPNCYVAQTTPFHFKHFYDCIMEANAYKGPSLIVCYSPCMPEHGIGDNESFAQGKLAVDSRAFPMFSYDPRRGESIAERLSLKGNPSMTKEWHVDKEGNIIDFVTFAKSQGRFVKQFSKEGAPSDLMKSANTDRNLNWKKLQDLAGVKREEA